MVCCSAGFSDEATGLPTPYPCRFHRKSGQLNHTAPPAQKIHRFFSWRNCHPPGYASSQCCDGLFEIPIYAKHNAFFPYPPSMVPPRAPWNRNDCWVYHEKQLGMTGTWILFHYPNSYRTLSEKIAGLLTN